MSIAAPTVNAILYTTTSQTSGQVQVVAAAPANATYALKAELYLGSSSPQLIATGTGSAGQAFAAIPTQSLNSWYDYFVLVYWTDSGSSSPPSLPGPIVTQIPMVESAAYDGTNVTVGFSLPPGPPYPSGAQVNVYSSPSSSQVVIGKATANASSIVIPANGKLKGDSYYIRVASVSGTSQGPYSDAFLLVSQSQTVSSVSYNEGKLSVNLGGTVPTGATGAQVQVLTGGAAVSTINSSSSGVSFLQFLDNQLPYTIAVRNIAMDPGTGMPTTGPLSVPLSIFTTSPAVKQTVAGNGSVEVTVQEPASPPASTSYSVNLYNNGQFISTTAASGTPPQASISGLSSGNYTVTARATLNNATGPESSPIPVLSVNVSGLQAYYDGRNVIASWNPVDHPLVTGYLATITVTTSGTPTSTLYTVAGPSLSQAVDLTNVTELTITVAAVGNSVQGITTSTVDVLAGNPAYYVADISSTGTPISPALFFSGTTPPVSSAITLYLPDLYGGNTGGNITKGPFVLTKESNPPFAYTLTMAAESDVWDFSAAATRLSVYTYYLELLAAVAGTTGASAMSIRAIQQAVAMGMPQTFAETLLYRYSLDPVHGFVDLLPGMRLQLRSESYQPYGINQPAADGYVTTGSVELDSVEYIASSGSRLLGLDVFLSKLTPPIVSPPQNGGMGGIIDMHGSAYAQPWYRLFYPAAFPGSDSPGTTGTDSGVTILAAMDWSTLNQATTFFKKNGGFDGMNVTGTALAYFRGRAFLRPLISVSVNKQQRYVALGTTVANLLAEAGADVNVSSVALNGLGFNREANRLQTASVLSAGYQLSDQRRVMLAYSSYAPLVDGSTVLDLPLVQGDSLSFGD